MKSKILLSIITATGLAFSSVALAGGAKTYQVTGPIREMNDSMIAVQKGKDRREVARDSGTKVTGDLKILRKFDDLEIVGCPCIYSLAMP